MTKFQSSAIRTNMTACIRVRSRSKQRSGLLNGLVVAPAG
ncbi:hypothetical protein NIES2104_20020 [Leptolyngbya sp. NIES-2104]|nr:hypothetical protein NIES2104_20020 [Leptolyngbya sp. NIES-2104]